MKKVFFLIFLIGAAIAAIASPVLADGFGSRSSWWLDQTVNQGIGYFFQSLNAADWEARQARAEARHEAMRAREMYYRERQMHLQEELRRERETARWQYQPRPVAGVAPPSRQGRCVQQSPGFQVCY